jgi:uncharacterized protein
MIRKLTKEDHEQVFPFLSQEPSINLFTIGDIEAFGYETDFQELWGEFDSEGNVGAVLLRYYKSFIPYASRNFDVQAFAEIINNSGGNYYLSGKTAIVEQFEGIDGLVLGQKQVTFFAECITKQNWKSNQPSVKEAELTDVDRIIDIRNSIEEFNMMDDARESLIHSMESKTARTYYTEDDGLMTACASTAAENSISSMIVGVCTRKEFRKQGLASSIMEQLFADVMNEGKILCLFYDNPAAGRIYKRLGFVDIGKWTMYR